MLLFERVEFMGMDNRIGKGIGGFSVTVVVVLKAFLMMNYSHISQIRAQASLVVFESQCVESCAAQHTQSYY